MNEADVTAAGSSNHATERASLGGTTRAVGAAQLERAHRLIPGGSHTYAKGDDQFPVGAPPFIVRGQGCRAWDADGNQFIEYNMGLRAVTLGHAFEPVVAAARDALSLGTNFTRPSLLEGDCAEAFLESVPTAEMVKFCKDGSTAVDAAIRLARAHTGRDLVLICGDHPFFSTSDWFIGSTPMPAGIPSAVRDLVRKFRYNDLASAALCFDENPGRIACVVLEAARTQEPAPGFLEGLRELCTRRGALLILDEMITGFRWHRSGAQHVYGVIPDLSTFGKALANGFALSALAGRREIMELGGIRTERERVFLMSTTHGAESHALAAGMATMRFYAENDVTALLHRQGRRLREGVQQHVDRLNLGRYFWMEGRDCCLFYVTADQDGKRCQTFRTLFLQETIRRGVIAPAFVTSYTHTDLDIDLTVEIVGEALEVYAHAVEDGVSGYVEGQAVKPVFRPRA